jgi:hypothetical protein
MTPDKDIRRCAGQQLTGDGEGRMLGQSPGGRRGKQTRSPCGRRIVNVRNGQRSGPSRCLVRRKVRCRQAFGRTVHSGDNRPHRLAHRTPPELLRLSKVVSMQ